MVYILAAIGAVTLVVLLWQGFGPTGGISGKGTEPPERPAPDDDPDFLRRISEQQRKPRDEN
ncbi:hypothetical protein CDG81_20805 [Actinopolyspora erythraea]|uniref:Secreted protein n=2 Tax=Actinopolyspora erythraea TaxID=414996 RepID=A0A099D902_9ACTN|nr:hypothetical protein CDG81_20805 [Actinopolyspora erythraea]KGI82613.1 hypothetical protein IL38_04075 [Actinopolyspora erythraea]